MNDEMKQGLPFDESKDGQADHVDLLLKFIADNQITADELAEAVQALQGEDSDEPTDEDGEEAFGMKFVK